jgi:hypothetical protein
MAENPMRLLFLCVALANCAWCQQMVSMQTSGDMAIVTLRINQQNFTTFSGAPYSTKRVNTRIQTHADGTHVTLQDQTVLFYRDTAGRNRTERQVAYRDTPYIVTIMDPILGCEYVLDPGNKVAHRLGGVQIHTTAAPTPAQQSERRDNDVLPRTTTSRSGVTTLVESLGTKTLLGLSAEGRRTTVTFPPGTLNGNDHAIVTVDESWNTTSLGGLLLASRNVTADSTETTYSLADLVSGEPDASLFVPPPGYRIVEEKGDFTVMVPRNPSSTVTKLVSHGPTAAPVRNAPFAGTRTHTGTQIVANGAVITNPEQTAFSAWRDSMGRVRTEWPGQGIAPGGVEIQDPTTGYVWTLDFVNKVAYRSSLSAMRGVPVLSASPAEAGTQKNPGGETVTTESLGVQTISGVAANGVRKTTVWPSGSVRKNDKPITNVSEIWTAQTEGVMLLEKNSSSDGNASTVTLKNFNTREPDPSLFKVPATYRIVDESGNEIQAKQ